MGRRPTISRKPVPWRILQLTFLCYIIALPLFSQGHIVSISANDSSGAIQFSGSWVPPTFFDWSGVDTPGIGGPNSSVCAMGVLSRYTIVEGDSFSFRFRGISAQLVLTSRPDHSPFTVDFDGQTFSGDTYSQVVGCGVAWSTPRASVVKEHTVTCTNHPTGQRIYLELLSVQFDDGSELPPPAPPSSPKPSPKPTNSPVTGTTTVSPQTKSVGSIAIHPNVPSGSATETDNSSDARGPGGTVVTLTITPVISLHPSDSGPPHSSQEPQRSSAASHAKGPTVAAVAVSSGLGILLLLMLLTLWRRRQIRRRLKGTAAHPLTMPVTDESSASDSVDTVAVASPAREKSTGHTRQSVPDTHASMRLADEDIDRIALRMHDMIDASRVRHRRTDSSSTLDSGRLNSALPPYI